MSTRSFGADSRMLRPGSKLWPPGVLDRALEFGDRPGRDLQTIFGPGCCATCLSISCLKAAITQADSLVFNRASTGLYLEAWLKKQGLYDQVQARSTRYPDGASVLEHVLKGQGTEIGFGAITEILLYRDKGLKFVGPLPADIQNYTAYSATVMTGTTQAAAARAFVAYLGGASGQAIFKAAGIEP